MPRWFRFLLLVAIGLSLAAPYSQAQCSDGVTLCDHGTQLLNTDVFTSSSQKD